MQMPSTKPLVTMAIPFSRNVSPDWAVSLRTILEPMNGTLRLCRTVNEPRDIARDALVDMARERESKFIFFLDDDVTVPPNILRALLYEFANASDDVKVIGGIYCTKTTPAMPLVYKTIGDGPFYKWRIGEVFPCELLATGMMMIKCDIFDKISPPYFKEVHTVTEGKSYGLLAEDYDGQNFSINDDGFFCHKVREAGGRIMAHGGMLGVHWDDKGTAYLLPDNSYPVKTEIDKRWKVPAKDEAEYIKRVMTIYKMAYGYIDLLPMEKEVAALVDGV